MSNLFPEPISSLPEAEMPFSNYQAYLSQGEEHQIIFMHLMRMLICQNTRMKVNEVLCLKARLN